MDQQIKKLIKPLVIVAIAIFALCCAYQKPVTWDDYSSYVGYAVSGVTLLFIAYDLWLWKLNPLEDTPILKKEYNGVIKFKNKRATGEKQIKVKVKQTLLSVRVDTETDINSSTTVTGVIAQENGKYALYYTYVTNPDAATQKNNPIQFGTCRMVLEKNTSKVKGKYWTTSETTGDIVWQA